jgi:DNA-binding transcriptional LysR family regulator
MSAWLDSWDSFIKVVESGSMAGAARRLGCSRAQVSRQIGQLEAALGARLFERSTRRLRPTPAGEAFYPHALAAVAAVDCAQRALSHLGSAPRGLLRISATMTFGREYIAPLLPTLTERHPELECELILTDQMVDLVDDRIDLALRQTQTPPADAVAKPLLQMERVICAAPEYLARHGTPEHPLQLAQHQCFSYLLTDDGHWRLRDARGEEWSAPVRGRVQYNNIDCLYQATLAGQGLSILPVYLCAPALADGRLRQVLPDCQPQVRFGQHLYACYTPSRVQLPKVQVFLAALEDLLQPEPPWRQIWPGPG